MAQAVGIAWSMVPPTSSHAARHSAGRIRFPPASNEYLHNQIDNMMISVAFGPLQARSRLVVSLAGLS